MWTRNILSVENMTVLKKKKKKRKYDCAMYTYVLCVSLCFPSQMYFEEIAFLTISLMLVIVHLFLSSAGFSTYEVVGTISFRKDL